MAGKSSGAKNNIYTGITLFIIAGFILAWVHLNNIKSGSDVYDYFHSLSNKAEQKGRECGAPELKLKCEGTLPQSSGDGKIHLPGHSGDGKIHLPGASNGGVNLPGSSGNGKINLPGGGTGSVGTATGAVKDAAGNVKEKLDLNPPKVPDAINNAGPSALSSIESLQGALANAKTEDAAKNAGYKRSQWRHWIGEPCDTRDNVLMAQGKNVKVTKTASTCKVTSGEWESPYDGKKFTDPSGMDIDHMIPLGYAALHGGQAWSPAKKQQFANDTTQLIAVSANANRSKSDKGPSEYMPRDSYKCQYARVWVATATKYGVSLTKKDKDVLSSTLKNCQ